MDGQLVRCNPVTEHGVGNEVLGLLARLGGGHVPGHHVTGKDVQDDVEVEVLAAFWSLELGYVPAPAHIGSVGHQLGFDLGRVRGLTAAFFDLAVGAQDPIEARHAGDIGPLVEQGEVDLVGRAVNEALRAQLGEMIEAMIDGERDPKVLAQMAKSVLRAKIPALEEAFSGHFGAHHAFLCREIIDHIDHLDASIASLSAEIARRLVPFEAAITILSSITGVSRTTAEVMIAEMGADMSRFPTAGHLCAWAGVAPASHESAGKHRPAGTRQGAPWLRRSLIEAAKATARTKGSYFSAQYARIARRRGPNKATVAVANSMLAVAWHLLTNGALYVDPGGDYFERRNDPAREAKRLQRRIEALGFEVTIETKAA